MEKMGGLKVSDLSFYKNKKILVTGHTGFKGSWLCQILVNAGAFVVGYGLTPPTNPNLFSLAGLEKKMESIIGDIRDFNHLKEVFENTKPEIVFHLAAQPIVRDSYKEPRYTYETNVMGTVNLMECIRLCPNVKSVVNVTTDKVYQNNEWCWGYREDENRIGPRIRDWIVSLPETGFLFPAFTERSTDIHSVLCYHKNPKEPHSEFVEGVFGCTSKRTAAEKKQAFEAIVKNAFGGDEDASLEGFYDIQEGLKTMSENQGEEEEGPVFLTPETIGEIMGESSIPKEAAAVIEESFTREFQDEIPELHHILDEKAAETGSRQKAEKELRQKVQVLEQELEDTKVLTPIDTGEEEEAPTGGVKTYDVILRVKPEKASQIKSQLIDGKKCLVIPLEENEHAAINGINTTV